MRQHLSSCLVVTLLLFAAPAALGALGIDGNFTPAFTRDTGASAQLMAVVPGAGTHAGKIIVAGNFHSVAGVSAINVARYNADGTLDATFNVGSGPSQAPQRLAVDSQGRVIIAGFFNSVNGITRNGLCRFNTDGSVDLAFDPGAGSNNINAVAVDASDRVYIGGTFATFNGTAVSNFARLTNSATVDASFDVDADMAVTALAVDSSDRIIFGGQFTTVTTVASGAVTRNFIARCSNTGELDASFNNDPDAGPDAGVFGLAIEGDNDVFIRGNFATVKDAAATSFTRDKVARLSAATGFIDTTFDAGVINSFVFGITAKSPDKLIIAGDFTTVGGTNATRIAVLNANGSVDGAFDTDPGASDFVFATAIAGSGDVFACGLFAQFDGQARIGIARLNPANFANLSVNSLQLVGIVKSVARDGSGLLIVGGQFDSINGVARKNIARLNADGTLDASYLVTPVVNGDVEAVAVQGANVLIGGNFTSIGGAARQSLARTNATGTVDGTWDPLAGAQASATSGGSSLIVYSLELQPDNMLLVGGDFDYDAAGNVYEHLLRIQNDAAGTPDFLFRTDNRNIGGIVRGTRYYTDGATDKVLVFGDFTVIDGANWGRACVQLIAADGARDAAFGTINMSGADAPVYAAVRQSGGKFVLGGGFATVRKLDGTMIAANRIARMDSTGQFDDLTAFQSGTGFDGISIPDVFALGLLTGDQVLVGGNFDTANGVSSRRLALLNSDGTRDASFTVTADRKVHRIIIQPDGSAIVAGEFRQMGGQSHLGLAKLSSSPPPTIMISLPSANMTRTQDVTYTITYTDATAITLANANVTLNSTGTATGTVAVSGTGLTTRTVTITGISGDGTIGISIAAGTASNPSGNAPAAGPSATFQVDNTGPTIALSAPSAVSTVTGPITYTVTYSGADAVTLADGNVTLNTTGTLAGTAVVSGTGLTTRAITVSNITGDGQLRVSVAAGTASDLAGNTAPAVGPSDPPVIVDTLPPSVTSTVGTTTTTLVVNQPVTFTVGATDASAMTYVWNFGDGTPTVTTSTPSVEHTYAVAGNYTITVTITDAMGQSTNSSMSLAILPEAGPGGGGLTPVAFKATQVTAALKFPSTLNKDSLTLKATVSLKDGFVVNGQAVSWNIGGITGETTLDEKGASPKSSTVKASLKFKKPKKGEAFTARDGTFTLTLKKQSLAALTLSGVTTLNATTSTKGIAATVALSVLLKDHQLHQDAARAGVYKGKQDKGGSFKSNK